VPGPNFTSRLLFHGVLCVLIGLSLRPAVGLRAQDVGVLPLLLKADYKNGVIRLMPMGLVIRDLLYQSVIISYTFVRNYG